jgi:signal transduction histidine kinase
MERNKMMVSDQYFRRQDAVILVLLVTMFLMAELIIVWMVQDYKVAMIDHDDAIAGYLLQHNVEEDIVAGAFTDDKDRKSKETGASLLSASGYDVHIQNSLLPIIERFHYQYAGIMFVFMLLFFIAFFAVLFFGQQRRNRQLEKAAEQLHCFMDGDTTIRLEDCGEGSLSKLFAVVNAMATSMTAHIEKERQNKEFLKNTISDISHQLKTPLAALSMYNEIIHDEKAENEVIDRFSEKSEKELSRMENLIQNLLKLARLDAGSVELEMKEHNIYDFLQNCNASFAIRAELEGKSIRLKCQESLKLSFDEIWLGEAVTNLLKNALDYTTCGDKIEVSCEETVTSVEIVIRDSGGGIQPEDIHHIFKRFYRSRYSKDKQGVGIGLSLVMAIMEKHGGTITVSSQLGNGAEFCLIIPKLTNL